MKITRAFCLLLSTTVVVACGGRAPAPATASSSTEPVPGQTGGAVLSARGAAVDIADGVLTFTSPPSAFDTNSYVLVGPTGLVVVDVQFLPSQAERLVAELEAETGKKIALAIVLHPNPDKFNGTSVFQKHGIKVVTSGQVAKHIPQVHTLRHGWFAPRYSPDYPETAPAIETFGGGDMTLDVAGLSLKLHVLGRGCSEDHVAVEWNGHLFVGDLVSNGTHAWLELGYVDAWLKRLEELQALAPKRVHPGRGPSGAAVLIGRQADYLTNVVRMVDAKQPTLPAPEGALPALIDEVKAAYPGYGYDVFLRVGMKAVWAARAQARAASETAPAAL